MIADWHRIKDELARIKDSSDPLVALASLVELFKHLESALAGTKHYDDLVTEASSYSESRLKKSLPALPSSVLGSFGPLSSATDRMREAFYIYWTVAHSPKWDRTTMLLDPGSSSLEELVGKLKRSTKYDSFCGCLQDLLSDSVAITGVVSAIKQDVFSLSSVKAMFPTSFLIRPRESVVAEERTIPHEFKDLPDSAFVKRFVLCDVQKMRDDQDRLHGTVMIPITSAHNER